MKNFRMYGKIFESWTRFFFRKVQNSPCFGGGGPQLSGATYMLERYRTAQIKDKYLNLNLETSPAWF